jgi:hypothetical protein
MGIFYLIYQYLGLSQLTNLWKKQYEDYIKELKEYNEQDKGNLTPEHLEILNRKSSLLQQTEASIVQTVTAFWTQLGKLAELAMGVAITVAILFFAPDIINKWKSLIAGKGGTAKAMSYIAICMTIEETAAKGEVIQASNLATVTQTYFATVDAPFMESEIARYQQIAQTVTGWMHYYALFMVQYYTLELQSIPYWFSMLPPLPPP